MRFSVTLRKTIMFKTIKYSKCLFWGISNGKIKQMIICIDFLENFMDMIYIL